MTGGLFYKAIKLIINNVLVSTTGYLAVQIQDLHTIIGNISIHHYVNITRF